jgi:hypothetical protein
MFRDDNPKRRIPHLFSWILVYIFRFYFFCFTLSSNPHILSLFFLFVLSTRQKPRIETSLTDPLQNSLKLSPPPPPPVYPHLFFQQSSHHCFHTDVSNENFLGWLLHTTDTEWAAYPCDIFPFAYRFWWGDLRERDNLEELNVNQRITLTCIFKRWDGKAWTELVWPMIETCGGLLWMRWWTIGFLKTQEISWVAEDVLDSQEGLCWRSYRSSSCHLLFFLICLSCSRT